MPTLRSPERRRGRRTKSESSPARSVETQESSVGNCGLGEIGPEVAVSRAGNKGKGDPKTLKKVRDRISAASLSETGKEGDLEGERSRQDDQN